MTSDVVLMMTAALAVAIGAFAGGAVGFGFPLVAVPGLTLAYGLETAVVISALPTLVIDLVNLYKTRAERDAAQGLLLFGGAAALGTVVGTVVRGSLDERVLIGMLAATIAIYLISEALLTLEARSLARRPITGVVTGSIAGLLQAGVGVAGPVVAIYFLSRTDSRRSFIFHFTTVLAITGVVRVAGLLSIGAYSTGRAWASLGLVFFVLGLRTIGFRVGDRLDRSTFRRGVLVLLAGSLIPLLLRVL